MARARNRQVRIPAGRGGGPVLVRRLLSFSWLMTLLLSSAGDPDHRTEERRSSRTTSRRIGSESSNLNERKSLHRVLERDKTSNGTQKVFNITFVFDDPPTSAPSKRFNASAVNDALLINNFISRSGVSTCLLNLFAADANSDGTLDRDEYAEFIRVESHGRIDEPFGSLDGVFVALYYAVACNQCYDETQNDQCCVGDDAGIVLPQQGDGHDAGQWVLFLCSAADQEIADEVGGTPTTSPSGGEPTETPAAGRPTAPTRKPTRAPNKPRPSDSPTSKPTRRRSRAPTASPTVNPSGIPTTEPTGVPMANPTNVPSVSSESPSSRPTSNPTRATEAPTSAPVSATTASPTIAPIATAPPTSAPVTLEPTDAPTSTPVTTSPTVTPSVATAAPVNTSPNDTLCVQFFYSLKNTAGLSANDILNGINNTLRTGLELATRNITIEILNASFPSSSASRSLSGSGTFGGAGVLPSPPSRGGTRRYLTDSSSTIEHATAQGAVRGQHVIYRGLLSEFGIESADRILDSLFLALYSPKGDCRKQQQQLSKQWNQRALADTRTRRQPSRRLVYYTDVLPPNVTDVVDDSFCSGQGGGTNSTSGGGGGGVNCAFVSTEVCVVLEEGDDPTAVEKAIDEGFRIAVLDGSFFDAIPPDNVP